MHSTNPSNLSTPFLPLSRRQSFYKDDSGEYITPLRINIPIQQKENSNMYSLLMDALLTTDDDEYEYILNQTDVQKSGNIILDIDGTLGDNIPKTFIENPVRFDNVVPIPRPGLKKFFAFVFANYERVSIWTAATPVWYSIFKEKILLPNMPTGATFHFERTRFPDESYVILKPLAEIYAKYPEEYNESNTTIVDDNVETFRDNRANAVHIPSFFYDNMGGSPDTRRINAAKDRGLYTIMEILLARRKCGN